MTVEIDCKCDQCNRPADADNIACGDCFDDARETKEEVEKELEELKETLGALEDENGAFRMENERLEAHIEALEEMLPLDTALNTIPK